MRDAARAGKLTDMLDAFYNRMSRTLAVAATMVLGACGKGHTNCVEKGCNKGFVCIDGDCAAVCTTHANCKQGQYCDASVGACRRGDSPSKSDATFVDPACADPTVNINQGQLARVYVGIPVEATGTATTTTPSCLLTAGWRVCDSPAASIYARDENGTPLLAGGCIELPPGDSVHFIPDKRGTYELQYRALSGGHETIVPITVEATADSLFVELQVFDGRQFALMEGNIEDSCHEHDMQQGDCNDEPLCGFSIESDTCELKPGVADCLVNDSESACAGSGTCTWIDLLDWCLPTCSLYGSSEAVCLSHGCSYDAQTSTCYLFQGGDGSMGELAQLAQPAFAQVYSDGGNVELLSFTTDGAAYRFDPNGVFLGKAAVGPGSSSASAGMGSLPANDAALLVHNYLFSQDNGAGGLNCGFARTLLLWQGTGEPGVPALVEPLTPLVSNFAAAASSPCTGLTDPTCSNTAGCVYDGSCMQGAPGVLDIGYPNLDGDKGGMRLRAVYGMTSATAKEGDLTDDCRTPGQDMTEVAYFMVPLLEGALTAPLADRTVMPLYAAERTGTNTAVGKLYADAGTYPCNNDEDCFCPGGVCAPGRCSAGHCADAVDVEGYLPRLFSDGDTVVFSHVACGGGYGTACSSPPAGAYDLMIGQLDPGPEGFLLKSPSFVAAMDNEDETDPIVRTTPDGTVELYYLSMVHELQSLQVQRADTTCGSPPCLVNESFVVPRYRLAKRVLSYDDTAGRWTAQPAADAPAEMVEEGSLIQTAGSFECNLELEPDGTPRFDEIVREAPSLHNPVQFTLSPDERYLAYADVVQPLECRTPICLSSQCAANLKPGAPVQGDIYLLDLSTTPPTSVRAYPPACDEVLGPTSSSPRFIAGGQQVVFNNTGAGGSKIYRINVADKDAPDCLLTEIVDRDKAGQLLANVDPKLKALGVGVHDSRTFIGPSCLDMSCDSGCGSCSAGEGFTMVSVLLAWRLRRRKRRATTPRSAA